MAPPRVGLLTGDNTINSEAPVVVMTTEVLRNMLYERSDTLRGLVSVVMDEVHYLQDPYRGAVWEEVLIHLPLSVSVVCLSATISNAEEFGEWIGTLRGETRVVIEERRPVPLEHHYLVGHRLHPMHVEQDGVPDPEPLRRSRSTRTSCARRPTTGGAAATRSISASPGRAKATAVSTCRGARRSSTCSRSTACCRRSTSCSAGPAATGACDGCARRASRSRAAPRPTTSASARRRAPRGSTRRTWSPSGSTTSSTGSRPGVAAHHAGMLPVFKETVEELFEAGLVKVVFATETLSLGINMPAKTVVIEDLWKFQGERHELLTPGEYTQLTGRAGRRGIDELGHAVVLYQKQVDFERVATLAQRRTYELVSSFRPSYNMAVNLARNYTEEQAHHLLNTSFAQFLADRKVVGLERERTARRRGDRGLPREHALPPRATSTSTGRC